MKVAGLKNIALVAALLAVPLVLAAGFATDRPAAPAGVWSTAR